MQPTVLISLAQCMQTWFVLAVFDIRGEKQRRVQKYLLDFCRGHVVLLVFSGVPDIPVESGILQ